MINETVKRLRAHGDRFYKAADIIERLLTSDPLDNPKAARAIELEVERNLGVRRGPGRPQGSRNTAKGFKYPPGTHWTQQRKNKERLAAAVAAGAARRKMDLPVVAEPIEAPAPAPAPPPVTKKRHHTGLHWTQKPEFASKLKGMHRKMMLAKKRAKKEKA